MGIYEDERREIILDYLARLPERTERCIRWRFGLGCREMTYDQIAARIGRSRERARQIIMKGLSLLRKWIILKGIRFSDLHSPESEYQWDEVYFVTYFPMRRFCPKCRCSEPVAEFRHWSHGSCVLCSNKVVRDFLGGELAVYFPGHPKQAWWKLYPDHPSADAGRRATFALYKRED